jgi:hypothetical protein
MDTLAAGSTVCTKGFTPTPARSGTKPGPKAWSTVDSVDHARPGAPLRATGTSASGDWHLGLTPPEAPVAAHLRLPTPTPCPPHVPDSATPPQKVALPDTSGTNRPAVNEAASRKWRRFFLRLSVG